MELKNINIINLANRFRINTLAGCNVDLGGWIIVLKCQNAFLFFTDINQYIDFSNKRYRFALTTRSSYQLENYEFYPVN